MSTQQGQDAKFFQRGKIEVRTTAQDIKCCPSQRIYIYPIGISRRNSGSGGKGQEIPEA